MRLCESLFGTVWEELWADVLLGKDVNIPFLQYVKRNWWCHSCTICHWSTLRAHHQTLLLFMTKVITVSKKEALLHDPSFVILWCNIRNGLLFSGLVMTVWSLNEAGESFRVTIIIIIQSLMAKAEPIVLILSTMPTMISLPEAQKMMLFISFDVSSIHFPKTQHSERDHNSFLPSHNCVHKLVLKARIPKVVSST